MVEPNPDLAAYVLYNRELEGAPKLLKWVRQSRGTVQVTRHENICAKGENSFPGCRSTYCAASNFHKTLGLSLYLPRFVRDAERRRVASVQLSSRVSIQKISQGR
jgi:hypothetical protein